MKPGDAIVIMGLWLWLSIAVGPWWIGVVLLVLGFAANLAQRRFLPTPEQQVHRQLERLFKR